MYQKPDFVKVSRKVKDVFANYSLTGCLPNGGGAQGQIDAGAGTCSDNGSSFVWTEVMGGPGCYFTKNP